jgi:hypothetical protein
MSGEVHAHTPETHVPLPHVNPHDPQFFGSVDTSMHAPGALPHKIFGEPHGAQTPLTHAPPVGHAFPHPPQLPGSLDTSTHAVPQMTFEPGHLHTPLVHTSPPAHTTPQSPQFESSLLGSMQVPLQIFFGATHVGVVSTPVSFGVVSIDVESVGDVSTPVPVSRTLVSTPVPESATDVSPPTDVSTPVPLSSPPVSTLTLPPHAENVATADTPTSSERKLVRMAPPEFPRA